MLRFLVRLIGYGFVAAGFVALVIDGARSIANSQVLFTPLGEALHGLLRERYLLIQPAIERHLHPLLWDPVILNLTLAPTAAVALALGFVLLWFGRRRDPGIGVVTRR